MNPDTEQIEDLFWQAKELASPEERAAFVDGLSHSSPELAAELRELLKDDSESDRVFGGLTEASSAAISPFDETMESAGGLESANVATSPLAAGTKIGAYKLLEPIGEGGMGLVYMAQQSEPVRRKVALKIIKPGMDSKQIVARFEAERQALAMMEHPNIAKVLDAGTTESGLPFFVMELVRGIPITHYCDQVKMPTPERLELFRDTCDAIQHAHNKGIIHRDIKPSNVLVTEQDGKPITKVIDFGVAKALTDNLTDKTLFTGMFQLMGTPLYMSPEQASLSGVDVDVRSDVYSLGVMLYELLSGALPIDREAIKDLSFDQLRERICETEPARPSKRLSTLDDEQRATVAERRGVNVSRLERLVTSELDWIVMRSLEKDRSRRYQSAREFAEDIERHLDGDAVAACPPSKVYRLQKFYRRNRLPVLCTVAIAMALCGATAFSMSQAARATSARNDAESNAQAAEAKADESAAILEYLITDVLKSSKPARALGREVTVKEMLKEAEARIDSSFIDRPLVKAAIQEAIASTYDSLGNPEASELQSRRALATRRELLGDLHRDTIQSMITHARSLNDLRRTPEARKLFHTAAENARKSLGQGDVLTRKAMYGISRCSFVESNYEEALAGLDRLLAMDADPLNDSKTPYSYTVLNAKSVTLKALGRYAEALNIQSKLVRDASRVVPDDHPELMTYRSVLAGLYEAAWEVDKAKEIYRSLIDSRERVYGSTARKTLNSKADLAHLKFKVEDFQGARKDFEELLPLFLANLGERDLATGFLYHSLGGTCHKMKDLDSAESYIRKSLDICDGSIGGEHYNSLLVKGSLAVVLGERGDTENALKLIDEVINQSRESRGEDDFLTLQTRAQKAAIYFSAKRYPDALRLHRDVYERRIELRGPTHPKTLSSADVLTQCLRKTQRHRETLELCESVLLRRDAVPKRLRYTFSSRAAFALTRMGRTPDSVQYFREAFEIARELHGVCGEPTQRQQVNLGYSLAISGEFERGVQLMRGVIDSNCGNGAQEANAKYNLTAVLSQHCENVGVQSNATKDARGASITMGLEAVEFASINRDSLAEDAKFLGPAKASREAWARRKVAVGYYGDDQFEEAVSQIENADKVQGSSDPYFAFIKAAALCRLGRIEASDAAYAEAQDWVIAQDAVPIRVLLFRDIADHAIRETTPAYAAYKAKDWNNAAQFYRDNLERYKAMGRPNPAIVLQRLSNCLAALQRLEEAEELARLSLLELGDFQDSPAFVTSASILLNLLNVQQKYDQAIEVADNVVPIAKLKMLASGQNDNRLMRLYAVRYSNLARSLALSESPKPNYREKAVEYGKLSVRLQSVPNNFNNLGVAYYQNGQFLEAVETLERADSMIEGGDREHRLFLAMAHWQLGNVDDAMRYYSQAIAWQEAQEDLSETQIRFRRIAEDLMRGPADDSLGETQSIDVPDPG